MLTLPRIYPITDASISGISHAEQVEVLIAGGATLIQLREKHASPNDFYNAAAEAIAVARRHGVKIIINDRVDIALALNADGVHLGQDDLPPAGARAILGDKVILGFSTHTLEQAREALKLPVDYIAFGPIFPTKTKQDPDAVVGLDGLREVRALSGDIPIVAIGGINADNVSFVLDAGADSAAMISAVIGDASKVESTMRTLLRSAEK